MARPAGKEQEQAPVLARGAAEGLRDGGGGPLQLLPQGVQQQGADTQGGGCRSKAKDTWLDLLYISSRYDVQLTRHLSIIIRVIRALIY